MRILIIAYYFPPETHAIMASLRPYSWAKYWGHSGQEICVLTKAKNQETVQQKLGSEVCIEEISPPFSRPKSSLSENSSIPTNPQSTLRERLIFFQKKLGAGSLLYSSNLWIFQALKRAIELHQENPFDVVVSTYSPPAAHIIAGTLKKRFDIFWVADYRDLWHDNAYTKARFPFAWLEKTIENHYTQKADLITTVSSPLAEQLARRFSPSIAIIENGFDPEDQPAENYPFPEDGKIRIAYTGSLYPGKQDPSPLWQALLILGQEKKRLQILFYTAETATIYSGLEPYSLSDIVRVHSLVPREKCLQIQRSVNALLFLDWNDPNTAGIVTGKIFEYMYSGVFVMAIGSQGETTASRLIQEAGIGRFFGNSPEAIAEGLKNLLAGKNLDYYPDQTVLDRYSREKLAKKMLTAIQEHQLKSRGYRS
jgi:hypothetical protein